MSAPAQDQLRALLDTAVARLRESLGPQAIYLFGSHVYGTPGPDSDIDLLVIVERSDLQPYQRDALANRALGNIPIPIDVQVYTCGEFEQRAALPVSFERTVKTKGKLLYAA